MDKNVGREREREKGRKCSKDVGQTQTQAAALQLCGYLAHLAQQLLS